MISDILFKAINDVEVFLIDPCYEKTYQQQADEIRALLTLMDLIRQKLDAPPKM